MSLWVSLANGGAEQKYPGFAEKVHEGLVDIFGEKGRYVVLWAHYLYPNLIPFHTTSYAGTLLPITPRMEVALEVRSSLVRYVRECCPQQC